MSAQQIETSQQEYQIKSKVPWEPYKAAINSDKNILDSEGKGFDKSKLIKYKIDTNLEAFNSKRPGYQFDEFDFKLIESNQLNLEENLNELFVKTKVKSNDLSTSLAKDLSFAVSDDSTNKLPPNFVDARLYPDAHFLKLANQLKKKSIQNVNDQLPLQTKSPKPVNVVGPMFEKKKELTSLNDAPNRSLCVDSNSIKLWKAQCEQYEARIDYLENQMKGINEQLQIQTQVNAELKKMLIASIGGEDMQYKLERLINDKQRYEFELENKAKSIEKLTEEIEQISIQCDLWRSKFLASKLLCEDNSTWKSFLLMLNAQNEKIIKNLLEDNDLLNLKVNQALDLLISFREKRDNSKAKQSPHKNKQLNNLQAINLILSNLCSMNQIDKTNGSNLFTEINSKFINLNLKKKSKTLNEMMAEQVLEQFDWVKHAVQLNSTSLPTNQSSANNLNLINSLDNLEHLIKKIKQNRCTKFSRLYQPDGDTELMLNVCKKCSGQIQQV